MPWQWHRDPLWGLGRVIALEHGELWGGLVDLDAATPLQAQLLAEVLQPRPDGETQVAYRQGTRHVARLVRRRRREQAAQSTPAIHADATYLITGGLGCTGLAGGGVAGRARGQPAILTGRRALPPIPSGTAVGD